MKVKMLTTAAGPDFAAGAGNVDEVDDGRGAALIEGGFAVEVDADGNELKAAEPAGGKPAGRKSK